MRFGSQLIGLSLSIVMAGCAAQATTASDRPVAETVDTANADYGQYPSNFEALVKQWASANLKDPDSVRYTRISKPRKEYMVANLKPAFGYSVCATINAKNSYGGYTGNQTYWLMIRGGKIERVQNIDSGVPGKMISRGHFVNCDDGE